LLLAADPEIDDRVLGSCWLRGRLEGVVESVVTVQVVGQSAEGPATARRVTLADLRFLRVARVFLIMMGTVIH
jgi:hypothetical protein